MRNIRAAEETDEVTGFCQLLLELGRRRPFRDPIASMGEEGLFTPAQFHTFIWLGHDGALTMGELARRLCVTEKSVTGLADRMERGGYLRRDRDDEDRRVVRLHLTRRGAQIFRRINDVFVRKLGLFLGALDASDRKDLFRILGKLLARADGLDAAAQKEKHEGHS
jgi:DNA-binding MarR family transcriptional regulator